MAIDVLLKPIGKMCIHSHMYFLINEIHKCKDNIFGIFFICSQPYKKSDGDSIRKIQGNETVGQDYPLFHIFIQSIQRDYFTEDVMKESRKGHGIFQQDFEDT